jgi:hypothetical protein
LASDDRLILGDFGLVYFEGQANERLSDTIGNVGSRDWMPGWAMGIRIEDLKPTFDISLGKLLWALVCPGKIMQLWYYDDPRFDLEKLFPGAPYIHLAKSLFGKCIVQEDRDCLPNAKALLGQIDEFLLTIDRGEI